MVSIQERFLIKRKVMMAPVHYVVSLSSDFLDYLDLRPETTLQYADFLSFNNLFHRTVKGQTNFGNLFLVYQPVFGCLRICTSYFFLPVFCINKLN